MFDKTIQIIGMIGVLIPYAVLCFLPFTGCLKFKLNNLLYVLLGLSLFHILISLCYLTSDFYNITTWQIYFICLLIACFGVYFFSIKAPFPKLLYVFLMIATYAYFISGITNFLEIAFFPEKFDMLFSPANTMLHGVLLLVSMPFIVYFLKKHVKPIVNSVDSTVWKTMWLIPAMFLVVVIVYIGNFEISVISSWQYIVILLLLALGSFLVYYVVLKMIKESDQNVKLIELADELAHQQKVRDALLQNISHDLRTPITVIRGAAEILSEGELPEADQLTLTRITTRITQLEKLVEDLLELNTIESGSRNFILEPLDVTELLQNVRNEYGLLCEKKKLYLHIEALNESVLADGRRIWQVFDNLIANALKYTDEGGITVTAKRQDGFCIFCIKDTGCGIAPEHLPFIFDRFYHCDTRNHGTGLGLPIVKGIIENMGGRMWAKSSCGNGTSVYFMLKCKENP